MSYDIRIKDLRFCIDYLNNKDLMAFKDGYRKMPAVVYYLGCASENLLEMGVDPFVPRDIRLPKSEDPEEPRQPQPV